MAWQISRWQNIASPVITAPSSGKSFKNASRGDFVLAKIGTGTFEIVSKLRLFDPKAERASPGRANSRRREENKKERVKSP